MGLARFFDIVAFFFRSFFMTGYASCSNELNDLDVVVVLLFDPEIYEHCESSIAMGSGGTSFGVSSVGAAFGNSIVL